jgi:hypothetical protein
MNWIKLLGVATAVVAMLIASPATAYADNPIPSPPPGEPLPMPLPPGTQYAPAGVEVYCPNLIWVRRCHQCTGDPAHQCWDR